jgi:hypothetical protein
MADTNTSTDALMSVAGGFLNASGPWLVLLVSRGPLFPPEFATASNISGIQIARQ